MSNTKFQVIASGLAKALSSQEIHEFLSDIVEILEAQIDKDTKWNSVKKETRHVIIGNKATITNTHPAALFLDQGTKAHVIEGNPLLVFQWQGKTIFARRVNHPGTKPTYFFTNAGKKAERLIRAQLQKKGQALFYKVVKG